MQQNYGRALRINLCVTEHKKKISRARLSRAIVEMLNSDSYVRRQTALYPGRGDAGSNP